MLSDSPYPAVDNNDGDEEDSDESDNSSNDESDEEILFYKHVDEIEMQEMQEDPKNMSQITSDSCFASNSNYCDENSKSLTANETEVPHPADDEEEANLQLLQCVAREAMSKNKVFALVGFCPEVRKELLRRGWVQKLSPAEMNPTFSEQFEKDRIIVSDCLGDFVPSLLWFQNRKPLTKCAPRDSLINRILYVTRTNIAKNGILVTIFNELHWHYVESDRRLCIFPRCYAIVNEAEKQAFIDNFRLTICTSFIFYLSKLKDFSSVFAKGGDIKTEVVDFAVVQVEKAVCQKRHYDLDSEIIDNTPSETFASHAKSYQSIMRGESLIKAENESVIDKYEKIIKIISNQMIPCFPQIFIDGYRNIWLLKSVSPPNNPSVVYNDEEAILQHIARNPNVKFVLQKFIERPMVIHSTKFNIRQFFLLTSSKATIDLWVYRDCYLKFQENEFSLNKLVRQNSSKTGVGATRNDLLPKSNMWSLSEFKECLDEMQKSTMWDDRIYPGIVESIKIIIKGSQDNFAFENNRFELYSANFLLTADYRPTLIGINNVFDLSSSNDTDKEIHKSIVSDLFNVVLDCPTTDLVGNFQKVYSITLPRFKKKRCSFSVSGLPIKSAQSPADSSSQEEIVNTPQKPKKPTVMKKKICPTLKCQATSNVPAKRSSTGKEAKVVDKSAGNVEKRSFNETFQQVVDRLYYNSIEKVKSLRKQQVEGTSFEGRISSEAKTSSEGVENKKRVSTLFFNKDIQSCTRTKSLRDVESAAGSILKHPVLKTLSAKTFPPKDCGIIEISPIKSGQTEYSNGEKLPNYLTNTTRDCPKSFALTALYKKEMSLKHIEPSSKWPSSIKKHL